MLIVFLSMCGPGRVENHGLRTLLLPLFALGVRRADDELSCRSVHAWAIRIQNGDV